MEYYYGILDKISATIWVFGELWPIVNGVMFWRFAPEIFVIKVGPGFIENLVKQVYWDDTGFQFNKFWWSS